MRYPVDSFENALDLSFQPAFAPPMPGEGARAPKCIPKAKYFCFLIPNRQDVVISTERTLEEEIIQACNRSSTCLYPDTAFSFSTHSLTFVQFFKSGRRGRLARASARPLPTSKSPTAVCAAAVTPCAPRRRCCSCPIRTSDSNLCDLLTRLGGHSDENPMTLLALTYTTPMPTLIPICWVDTALLVSLFCRRLSNGSVLEKRSLFSKRTRLSQLCEVGR